jgi:hypothetical protein
LKVEYNNGEKVKEEKMWKKWKEYFFIYEKLIFNV